MMGQRSLPPKPTHLVKVSRLHINFESGTRIFYMFEPNHTTDEYWQESSVKRNPTVFTNKTTALLDHL